MKRLARACLAHFALMLCLGGPAWAAGPNQPFYVSTAGRDSWSGRLAVPNQELTDGPFASITRARDAIRAISAEERNAGPMSVLIRGGRYYLDGPVTFGPNDSGTEQGPISYAAYPGEMPEFIGGRRLTGPSAPQRDGVVTFKLPDSGHGPWTFRSLFVDGQRETRARFPNLDATDPIRKGFLYAADGPNPFAFGITVGGIHNAGDWLEYRVVVPEAGEYTFWLHYGALNAPYGVTSMNGRTAVFVDGRGPVNLVDLQDTGGWSPTRWARAASLRLSAGEHLLRWQNQKGGGLVLDALALCGDPAWVPKGTDLAPPKRGHLVGVAAKQFVRSHGRQITVDGAGTGPKDVIWCGPGDFHPTWLAAPDPEIHIFQSGDCRAFLEILSIRGYDARERRLQLGGSEARSALNPGDRYFVENVREELDAPGEWFLDARAKTLAYLPRGTFSTRSEVIVPMTTRLIQVEGHRSTRTPVRHLRFAGLTFRNTDWARSDASAGYGVGDSGAVHFQNAESCVVEDCHFLNLGTYAVCLAQGRGNTVRRCEVAHAGGGGVLILESGGNLVTDNHMHHLGEAYRHIGGIVLTGSGASGNTLSHNAIHDSSRYGISLKSPGKRNIIEFNRIQNTNLETFDSGGIEVTQHDRTFRSGSSIRNNLVTDTIGYSSTFGVPTFMSWGIYLDSFASGYEVTGNVVSRTWNGGIMLQGGKDNRVTHNIFVDGQVSQGTIANYERQSSGLLVSSNVIAYSTSAATTFDTGNLGPEVIRIDRNLYFPPHGTAPVFGAAGTTSFAEWKRLGRDPASLVGDPRFRNAVADDYTPQAGSPAFQVGFKPVPLDRVGPKTRKCLCRVRGAGRTFWMGGLPGTR